MRRLIIASKKVPNMWFSVGLLTMEYQRGHIATTYWALIISI